MCLNSAVKRPNRQKKNMTKTHSHTAAQERYPVFRRTLTEGGESSQGAQHYRKAHHGKHNSIVHTQFALQFLSHFPQLYLGARFFCVMQSLCILSPFLLYLSVCSFLPWFVVANNVRDLSKQILYLRHCHPTLAEVIYLN